MDIIITTSKGKFTLKACSHFSALTVQGIDEYHFRMSFKDKDDLWKLLWESFPENAMKSIFVAPPLEGTNSTMYGIFVPVELVKKVEIWDMKFEK